MPEHRTHVVGSFEEPFTEEEIAGRLKGVERGENTSVEKYLLGCITEAHDRLGHPTPENVEAVARLLEPLSLHARADRGPDD